MIYLCQHIDFDKVIIKESFKEVNDFTYQFGTYKENDTTMYLDYDNEIMYLAIKSLPKGEKEYIDKSDQFEVLSESDFNQKIELLS